MSIFLVDTDNPGWKVARYIKVLAQRTWGDEVEMKLENCVVPAKNMLAEGRGFHAGQTQFNAARIAVGASALGKAEKCLELAIEFAKQRQTFGRPLGSFEAIQWMLTDSKFDCECIRWLTYHTAWKLDKGMDAQMDVAMVKAYCTEAGLRVIDRCMQVLGGRGLCSDDYPFCDAYNMLRMCKQMEGSTEIMKIVMARELLGREIVRLSY